MPVRILPLTTLVLCLLAAPVAGEDEVDAFEPNDAFDAAKVVALNEAFEFSIHPVRDVDWFRTEVTGPGYVRVEIDKAAARHVDPVVGLYRGEDDRIGGWEARVQAGPLWIAVHESGADEAGAGLLVGTVRFWPETDPTEPNHGFARARKAALNVPMPYATMPAGDLDTFQLTIPQPGHLYVSCDDSAAREVDPVVRTYDANQELLGKHDVRVPAGKVYVNLSERNDDESAPQNISVTFHYQPETDATEPNDTFALARAAPLNTPVELAIVPFDDRDLFQLDVPSRGVLRVRLDRGAARELDVTPMLYDADQQLLGEWEKRVEPGTVYVLLAEDEANESSFASMHATFHFFPEEDASEPNERFATARPVAFGESAAFAIMPRDDRDTFRLSIDEPGTLRVQVDQSAANHLDLQVGIFDAHGRRLGEGRAPVGTGTVFVRIQEGQQNESSPAMLHASFELTPAEPDDPRRSLLEAATPAVLGSSQGFTLTKERSWRAYRLEITEYGELASVLTWEGEAPAGARVRVYDTTLRDLGAGAAIVSPGAAYVLVSVDPAHLETARDGFLGFSLTPGNDAHEPNRTFLDAREIQSLERTSFTLFPRGDGDVFRVPIERRGYLYASVDRGAAKNLNPQVQLYDARYRRLGSRGGRVEPGIVYVWIHDRGDDNASTEPIHTKLTFHPESDVSEPNDGFANARSVAVDASVAFQILPNGDRDRFRMEVPRAGYLHVVVDEGSAADLDTWAVIYDGDQRRLGRGGARVQAGLVYVQIGDSGDDESSYESLKAHFRFTPDPDAGEPNDTLPRAQQAELGTSYEVHLMPNTDQDVYRVEAPGPGSLQVRLDPHRAERLQPHVEIFDAWQDRIGQASARVAAGPAYVRIENRARGQITSEPIRATILFLPDEPPESTVRQVGEGIELTLAEDGAYVSVPIRSDRPCCFAVEDLFPPQALEDVVLELVGPSGQVLLAEGPPLHPPGLYHLIAHAAKGSSPTPFAVRVDAIEPIDLFEPNDDASQATQIDLPFTGWICLHARPHVDHFRFDAQARGLYQVRLEHEEDIGADIRLWPEGRPERAATLLATRHSSASYSALYARLEPGRYDLQLAGKAVRDVNANPVRLTVSALSTGARPPGDLKIMAFGIAEGSKAYEAIRRLSEMVRAPVSRGGEAEDVAEELRSAVTTPARTEPVPEDPQPTSPSVAARPASEAGAVEPRTPVLRIIGGLLLAVAVLGSLVLLRRRRVG